jgi:hypothetical protein
VAGWFAYKKQRGYGLALQGGGLAILYLTTYSAYAHLRAAAGAGRLWLFCVAISAFGIVLALLQDAWLLAYMAMVGAFAAPILAADGGGNYAGLLGYYAVVAVTAVTLALRKGWQGLALLSLLGVYGVGMLNSAASFTPDDYTGTLAFVAFFFGLFLAASLLLALRPGAGRRVLDLVIAVLNPIAALGWLAIITQHTDKDLGYALAAGGALYLAVFGVLAWKRLDKLAVHRELSLFWGIVPAHNCRADLCGDAYHGERLGGGRRAVDLAELAAGRGVADFLGLVHTGGGGVVLCANSRRCGVAGGADRDRLSPLPQRVHHWAGRSWRWQVWSRPGCWGGSHSASSDRRTAVCCTASPR